MAKPLSVPPRTEPYASKPFDFAFLSFSLLFARLMMYSVCSIWNPKSASGASWTEFVGSGFLLNTDMEHGIDIAIFSCILSWSGYWLICKRLKDMDWHPLTALLFFVPFCNIVLWGILCTTFVPEKTTPVTQSAGRNYLCDFPVWTALAAAFIGTLVAIGIIAPSRSLNYAPEITFYDSISFGILIYSSMAAGFFVCLICSARIETGFDDCFKIGICSATFVAIGLGFIGIAEMWSFFLVPMLAVPVLIGTLVGRIFASFLQEGLWANFKKWLA